jgi:hypothetical protein
MSWSVGVSQKSKEELVNALNESFDKNYSEPHEAVKNQFEAARDSVSDLLNTLDGEAFNASLSGHSQAAMPGSASDGLPISLYATTPVPPVVS